MAAQAPAVVEAKVIATSKKVDKKVDKKVKATKAA
jgi:hypothetical protein